MMVLILIVLFLGLGYAYLNTTLSINGISNVVSNTWNIYWDNDKIKSGSVTGEQVITVPTIDTNKTSVVFRVHLKKTGEYYEFTVDARNDGSLDAMISEIKTYVNNIEEGSIPSYLKVSLTCEGVNVGEKQELKANTTDGAMEKHVPVVEKEDQKITVTCGEVLHPMEEKHYIEFIAIETNLGVSLHYLKPGEEPVARFHLVEKEEFLSAYAYCNLHGLWKNKD